jgi:hypothetical protein
MVNRPSTDGNFYWDDPVNRIRKDEARLAFVDHFDRANWALSTFNIIEFEL